MYIGILKYVEIHFISILVPNVLVNISGKKFKDKSSRYHRTMFGRTIYLGHVDQLRKRLALIAPHTSIMPRSHPTFQYFGKLNINLTPQFMAF